MILRKLLTLLLMLILPLQGIAATFAPLHQALTASATSAMPCHEQHVQHDAQATMHDGAAAGENAPAPSSTPTQPRDADATNHLCCHQIFTCMTTSTLATPAHKFGDVPRVVLPLATLFIPDSPDRPPRG